MSILDEDETYFSHLWSLPNKRDDTNSPSASSHGLHGNGFHFHERKPDAWQQRQSSRQQADDDVDAEAEMYIEQKHKYGAKQKQKKIDVDAEADDFIRYEHRKFNWFSKSTRLE